ncbi:hypothetical protein F4809DRAFT_626262 [Biscogniauxia mediterranea]|nr:hypothetical protein F4809DRAFT_626262 [Biscogniauxia mediterranea]
MGRSTHIHNQYTRARRVAAGTIVVPVVVRYHSWLELVSDIPTYVLLLYAPSACIVGGWLVILRIRPSPARSLGQRADHDP